MGLDDFKNLPPKSDWMEELENQAENRGLTVVYSPVAANSYYFKIEGDRTCAIGKTHHTRESKRTEHYINLNSANEANWRGQPENIPPELTGDKEIVDIFGIVVNHHSPNGYDPNQDDFLVLTEDILEEIPESGKKAFRITSSGYRHPFGKYVNSWGRIFEEVS